VPSGGNLQSKIQGEWEDVMRFRMTQDDETRHIGGLGGV
jgi:hypothetical protein